jgi:hypothetical protein
MFLTSGVLNGDEDIAIFKNNETYDQDYILGLTNSDESLYETLLNQDTSLEIANYMGNSNRYISHDDIEVAIESMDINIFDRIIADYYMQPGVPNSRESIQFQIGVIGTIEGTNEAGHIILNPQVNLEKDK